MALTKRRPLVLVSGELKQLPSSEALNAITESAFIIGTDTDDEAPAGYIGEYVFNSASGVALVTGTAKTITSITLSAGDWDVFGDVKYSPAGTTSVSLFTQGTSETTNTFEVEETYSFWLFSPFVPGVTGEKFPVPMRRAQVPSGTVTIYLIARASFTISTMTANGYIRARRAR